MLLSQSRYVGVAKMHGKYSSGGVSVMAIEYVAACRKQQLRRQLPCRRSCSGVRLRQQLS